MKAKSWFWAQDFNEMEKDAIRTLFGAPECDEQSEPDEPQAVMVNLVTAVADTMLRMQKPKN